MLTKGLFEILGGPGSGHHGHKGRPGKEGGSSPGMGGSDVRGHIKPVHWKWHVSQIAMDAGVSGSKAKSFSDAVNEYLGGYTDDIRHQSKGQGSRYYKYLQEFIDKSPKWGDSGALYRGLHADNATIKTLKKGAKLDMRGLSSWTSSKSIAGRFTKLAPRKGDSPVMFRMASGTMHGTSVSHLSDWPKQNEVLVGKRALFKIKSVSKTGGVLQVDVEDIG